MTSLSSLTSSLQSTPPPGEDHIDTFARPDTLSFMKDRWLLLSPLAAAPLLPLGACAGVSSLCAPPICSPLLLVFSSALFHSSARTALV
jgi:hypothetical protein